MSGSDCVNEGLGQLSEKNEPSETDIDLTPKYHEQIQKLLEHHHEKGNISNEVLVMGFLNQSESRTDIFYLLLKNQNI